MAGWSLALALLPSLITWVLAVVFASIVMSRSKDGRPHGKGMAIAAFVIVGVYVVGIVVAVAAYLATGADRDASGRVTDAGRVTVVDLRTGDCLPDAGLEGEQLMVQIVPCGDSHVSEVFATFDLDGQWSSPREVDRISEGGCLERFSDFVGVRQRRSSLDVFYLRPTNEQAFDADRGVVCLLVAPEPLTGSLEGSGR